MIAGMMLSLMMSGTAGDAIPVAPPPRARKITNCGTFTGEVLAVDARSITICGKEEEGHLVEKLVRHFPAGTALRKGEQDPSEKGSSNYRLSDVKVGDIVYIMIHVYGEEHLCVSVCIKRRPGGVVPKAPFEDPDTTTPFHERMNAFQQFEERGIPLPLKFDLEYQRAVTAARASQAKVNLDRMRHDERMKFEGRIAPAPRHAKARRFRSTEDHELRIEIAF